MSNWTVHLELEEGTSRKFWRARVEGKTLYVNYGRIGTGGQTQVKDLADAAAAQREYEKLVREKRKKGYADASSAGARGAGADDGDDADDDLDEGADGSAAAAAAADDDDDDDGDGDGDGDGDADRDAAPARRRKPAGAAAAKPAAAARPGGGRRMVLEIGGRRVETRLHLDGATVRMDALETHDSPEAAKQAYERLVRALAADGYRDG